MGRRDYPPEFRRRVIDLVEGGRRVAEVALDLGISEQTVYSWRRQDRIDRGLEPGLSTPSRAASDSDWLGPVGIGMVGGATVEVVAAAAAVDVSGPPASPRPNVDVEPTTPGSEQAAAATTTTNSFANLFTTICPQTCRPCLISERPSTVRSSTAPLHNRPVRLL